jgi:peroxin-19
MAAVAGAEDDLDDILDQALDDLEQIDAVQVGESSTKDTPHLSPSTPSTGLAMNPPQEFESLLTVNDAEDEGDVKLLEQFMKQMQSAVNDTKTKSKKTTKNGSKNHPLGPNDDVTDVEATLASILQQMTTMDPDDLDDDFLAAGGLNPDSIVDGMMQQLLSKDLMYEPMKHVADQFPAWLEEKENSLSVAELAK